MEPSHVNQADVAHHGSNASAWWNPDGPVRLLFKLNPLRIDYICEVLNKTGTRDSDLLKGLQIVDAACGGGLLTEALASLGAEMTGVDASDALINVAKQHAQEQPDLQNIPNYVCSSVEEFAAKSVGQYDVVVASEIIEHVVDHEVFLKACCQMLRPGGDLIITTPHKSWSSWLYVIVWLEKIWSIIPRGTHSYNLFITPQQITNIIEKYDCRTKGSRNFSYSYMADKWIWGKEMWYALHAKKD